MNAKLTEFKLYLCSAGNKRVLQDPIGTPEIVDPRFKVMLEEHQQADVRELLSSRIQSMIAMVRTG